MTLCGVFLPERRRHGLNPEWNGKGVSLVNVRCFLHTKRSSLGRNTPKAGSELEPDEAAATSFGCERWFPCVAKAPSKKVYFAPRVALTRQYTTHPDHLPNAHFNIYVDAPPICFLLQVERIPLSSRRTRRDTSMWGWSIELTPPIIQPRPFVVSYHTSTQIIELDRARLMRNEQRAMEAKHNGEPLKRVSCQADAAGQIGFGTPMQHPVTHGTDRYENTFRRYRESLVTKEDLLSRNI